MIGDRIFFDIRPAFNSKEIESVAQTLIPNSSIFVIHGSTILYEILKYQRFTQLDCKNIGNTN